jgi:septum formation protein
LERKADPDHSMRELLTVTLASASPRRLELLASLGLQVRVVPSGIEETPQPGVTPERLAALHAEAKARAVAFRESQHLIVAADTVVDLDGTALGKPRDARDAHRILLALSGRSHLVHTAVFAIDPMSREQLRLSSTSHVTFTTLDPPRIEAYIETGDPFDKAGAYGIQGPGCALVERIEGDFYTVMGFPLGLFVRSLDKLNYTLARVP